MSKLGTQPLLHDLDVCLSAPTSVLADGAGQVRPEGVQGVFHGDLRVLAEARLLVGGAEPVPLTGYEEDAGRSAYVAVMPGLGDAGHDPTIRVTRRRVVRPGSIAEDVELRSTAREPVETDVRLELASDLADLQAVRRGEVLPTVAPSTGNGGTLRWRRDGAGADVRVTADAAELDGTAFRWHVALPPGGSVVLRWQLHVDDPTSVVAPPTGAGDWAEPRVQADDRRLPALVERSLADLRSLRLATSARPDDTFLAAGAPWYLTLFGRDSLWAARMLLPLGTELAATTLRVLAGYQGTRHDPASAEAPGKILHELRGATVALHGGDVLLPPVYYGTVDATMLWVMLLHDAWRWGLPAETVRSLLPNLEAAVGWLLDESDPDGDGFVEYVDESGSGLANQGWKDSGDAVRFRDGRFAEPPIALCEVQGYAHETALGAAALLDAFDRPGADRLREYAAALNAAFRSRFWVEDDRGAYPAMALDGAKRPVDSTTSNIGHLLGTGLLDADEVALVARRLVAPDLCSGYGLRTMSATDTGYAPLSYHCGSVWPHDTAIVATGLMREGRTSEAATLVEGLLAAAPAFGYRMPELYAGDGAAEAARPVPYPTSCRPQAWSAASAVAALQVLLGLRADVPAGVLHVAPAAPSPVGALSFDGLRVGADRVRVATTRDGALAEVAGCSLEVR